MSWYSLGTCSIVYCDLCLGMLHSGSPVSTMTNCCVWSLYKYEWADVCDVIYHPGTLSDTFASLFRRCSFLCLAVLINCYKSTTCQSFPLSFFCWPYLLYLSITTLCNTRVSKTLSTFELFKTVLQQRIMQFLMQSFQILSLSLVLSKMSVDNHHAVGDCACVKQHVW